MYGHQHKQKLNIVSSNVVITYYDIICTFGDCKNFQISFSWNMSAMKYKKRYIGAEKQIHTVASNPAWDARKHPSGLGF